MNEDKNSRTHYFAYGSNLWLKQMTTRCPSSITVGTAILPRYRWGICPRGFANVIPSTEDKCYGVIYSIANEEIELLDRFEGVPYDYERKYLKTQMMDDGRLLEAIVYVDWRLEVGKAKAEYVRRINNGLNDASGIPRDWVKKYIRPYIPDRDIAV